MAFVRRARTPRRAGAPESARSACARACVARAGWAWGFRTRCGAGRVRQARARRWPVESVAFIEGRCRNRERVRRLWREGRTPARVAQAAAELDVESRLARRTLAAGRSDRARYFKTYGCTTATRARGRGVCRGRRSRKPSPNCVGGWRRTARRCARRRLEPLEQVEPVLSFPPTVQMTPRRSRGLPRTWREPHHPSAGNHGRGGVQWTSSRWPPGASRVTHCSRRRSRSGMAR